MLNITDVKIILPKSRTSKLCAIASLIIDDCFAIHDIKVIAGKRGTFVAMPAVESSNGSFRDIAHPLDSDTRKTITERILDAYSRAVIGETPAM